MVECEQALDRLKNLDIGSVFLIDRVEVGREDLVRYAGVSGDFNPIHYRDDYARAVGLDGVVAHGMLTMALAIGPFLEWLGPAVGRILSYSARFTRPVFVRASENVLEEKPARIELRTGLRERKSAAAVVEITALFEGRTVLGRARIKVAL